MFERLITAFIVLVAVGIVSNATASLRALA